MVSTLDRAQIEYMITGSTASSLQGEPRLTHDLDVVVVISAVQIPALLAAFPSPDFYVSREAVEEAINTGGTFNVLDTREGDKVDFWMLTDSAFDQSRFRRRYEQEVLGVRLKVSSPEDTILAKLRWAALSGGSEKQFQDALRVYEVQAETLDVAYVEHWADRLGVREAWERIRAEADLP